MSETQDKTPMGTVNKREEQFREWYDLITSNGAQIGIDFINSENETVHYVKFHIKKDKTDKWLYVSESNDGIAVYDNSFNGFYRTEDKLAQGKEYNLWKTVLEYKKLKSIGTTEFSCKGETDLYNGKKFLDEILPSLGKALNPHAEIVERNSTQTAETTTTEVFNETTTDNPEVADWSSAQPAETAAAEVSSETTTTNTKEELFDFAASKKEKEEYLKSTTQELYDDFSANLGKAETTTIRPGFGNLPQSTSAVPILSNIYGIGGQPNRPEISGDVGGGPSLSAAIGGGILGFIACLAVVTGVSCLFTWRRNKTQNQRNRNVEENSTYIKNTQFEPLLETYKVNPLPKPPRQTQIKEEKLFLDSVFVDEVEVYCPYFSLYQKERAGIESFVRRQYAPAQEQLIEVEVHTEKERQTPPSPKRDQIFQGLEEARQVLKQDLDFQKVIFQKVMKELTKTITERQKTSESTSSSLSNLSVVSHISEHSKAA